MSSADGLTWTSKVTLGDTSGTGPGLAFANGSLYLLWVSADANLSRNVMTSPSSLADKQTYDDTSAAWPALAVFRGDIYLGWTRRRSSTMSASRT